MLDQKNTGKGTLLLLRRGPVGPANRVSSAIKRVDFNRSQIADKIHGKGVLRFLPTGPLMGCINYMKGYSFLMPKMPIVI